MLIIIKKKNFYPSLHIAWPWPHANIFRNLSVAESKYTHFIILYVTVLFLVFSSLWYFPVCEDCILILLIANLHKVLQGWYLQGKLITPNFATTLHFVLKFYNNQFSISFVSLIGWYVVPFFRETFTCCFRYQMSFLIRQRPGCRKDYNNKG